MWNGGDRIMIWVSLLIFTELLHITVWWDQSLYLHSVQLI